MKKAKEQYPKLKESLRQRLRNDGFEENHKNYYTKNFKWPRSEVSFTLYDVFFEKYGREYPAKEGWYKDKLKYTKANVNNTRLGIY